MSDLSTNAHKSLSHQGIPKMMRHIVELLFFVFNKYAGIRQNRMGSLLTPSYEKILSSLIIFGQKNDLNVCTSRMIAIRSAQRNPARAIVSLYTLIFLRTAMLPNENASRKTAKARKDPQGMG
ncbi:Uncharacterised protein [uncultured archaeon]|nr:Uncharacterised protein [uncultured archaeon]